MNIEHLAKIKLIAQEITVIKEKFASMDCNAWDYSAMLCDAVGRGLQCIADGFNFPAVIGGCDSRCEYKFSGNGGNKDVPCKAFGDELAELLSQVTTRTGLAPRNGPVPSDNGWLVIHRSEAEKLILKVGEVEK
jgi:hypothetical protein